MILDSVSTDNGDNSLSTFYIEYRGTILSIIHSNINGVDYIGGTIKCDFLPDWLINFGSYPDGLDNFISVFKDCIDFHLVRRAINSMNDSDV